MSVVSVVLAIMGPKLLGNATTLIFEGYISSQLPAGVPLDDIIAGLQRRRARPTRRTCSRRWTSCPGQGVDFTQLGRLLTLVALLYLVSALLGWASAYIMAGVTQSTIYELREEVDRKIGRLPLHYFDTHPRGDLLSRVTNDIDNVSNTLQQVLTQLITSMLTVIGVLGIMFWMSPLLAVISLLTVPAVVRRDHADRQALAEAVRLPVGVDRVAQRPRRADVHRPRPGQGVRPLGAGDRGVRRAQRADVRRRASRRSSSPGSSSRR